MGWELGAEGKFPGQGKEHLSRHPKKNEHTSNCSLGKTTIMML